MCAPCSAAILHANDKYLASFPMSLPTAVTAKTGIPYSSASFTNLPRLTIVWCSYFEPTKIDIASALALSLIASLTLVVICSLERSSPIILEPPDTRKTIGIGYAASTDVRWTPLVSIKESQYRIIGLIVFCGFSSFSVGPRKYPWSTANINARLSNGLIILEILFFKPQSIFSLLNMKKNPFLSLMNLE